VTNPDDLDGQARVAMGAKLSTQPLPVLYALAARLEEQAQGDSSLTGQARRRLAEIVERRADLRVQLS